MNDENKKVFSLYNYLPQIDLHGEDRTIAIYLVNKFINENKILKNKEFLIIHGIGKGILRKEIHNFLKKNQDVIEYKIDYFNPGATIVKLCVDK